MVTKIAERGDIKLPESFKFSRSKVDEKLLEKPFWKSVKVKAPMEFGLATDAAWASTVLTKDNKVAEREARNTLERLISDRLDRLSDASIAGLLAVSAKQVEASMKKGTYYCPSSGSSPFESIRDDEIFAAIGGESALLAALTDQSKKIEISEEDALETITSFYIDSTAQGKFNFGNMTFSYRFECSTLSNMMKAVTSLPTEQQAKIVRAFYSMQGKIPAASRMGQGE